MTFQLPGVVAGIAGYGETLYVGTQEGTLYAVKLKKDVKSSKLPLDRYNLS